MMNPAKDGPDKFSHEWYLQQLRGITHLQRLLAVTQEDQGDEVADLRLRVAVLESERTEMLAKIGELDAWMHEIEKIRQERLKQKSA